MPNEETEGRDLYLLLGVGGRDPEAIRALARAWLISGAACDPVRAASLRPLRDAPRRPRR